MPKKLAVFCDGTWNDLRTEHLTNVARLAKCVAQVDPVTRMQQIVYYDEGVGVSSNISKGTDELVKISGGAFGRGLDRKIEAAYRFIVMNYEPDDEIFVFGFSRGAYTARSLCGLIRKCGIIRRDSFHMVPKAMENYRNELHPGSPEMIQFRRDFSHPRSSGPEDDVWVTEKLERRVAEHSGRDDSTVEIPPQRYPAPFPDENRRAWLFQHRKAHSYRMMFLGVWDTVGSLGIPLRFGWLLGFLNEKYKFHDTRISSLHSSVRHAVAIEEDRRVFDAATMANIDELNSEWAEANAKRGRGWNVVDHTAANFVPYNHRPYQQVWFPGGHGAVGGGNPEPGLPNATLLWIAEGAAWAGLAFSQDQRSELALAAVKADPYAAWRIDKKGNPKSKNAFDLLGWIGGRKLRRGPDRLEEVGMTARLRWCNSTKKWRPKNLRPLSAMPCPPGSLPAAPPGYPTAAGVPDPACYPLFGVAVQAGDGKVSAAGEEDTTVRLPIFNAKRDGGP
ncbi:MAG: DUF2235 domain-containing protein [Hyphomonadaceae bacterium]